MKLLSRRRLPKRLRGWSGRSLMLLGLALGIALIAAGGGVYAALGGSLRGSQATDINLQKGLVGWWKLDGNAHDSSPYRNNASTVNGASLTTDRKAKANSAYSFNGTSNYIQVPNPASGVYNFGTSNFTTSAWVYRTASGTNIIVGKRIYPPGFVLYFVGSTLEFQINDATANNYVLGTVSGISTWHQITVVVQRSSNQLFYYLDGSLVNTVATSGSTGSINNAGFFGIGADQADTTNVFAGSIDDVRLYNRTLSAAEVTALYQQYNPTLKVAAGEQSLAGWWKLDGTAKDSSPSRNNGTVVNSASLTTDRKGNANSAYSFNGSNQYISVAGPTLNNDPITFSLWVKEASSTFGTYLIGSNDYGAYLRDDGGGHYYWDIRNSASGEHNLTATIPSYNQWHLLTGTYDGTTQNLYVDGTLQATASLSITPNTTAGIGIGTCIFCGPGQYATGSIDDVRIYKRALSASDVANLYNSYNAQVSVSSLQQGEVADWNFNGNAKDSTPYRNNGTVSGATLTTDREGRSNSAYSFNGSSNYITTANVNTGTSISVGAWVYTTSNGQQGFVVGKNPVNSEWELFYESGTLRWRSSVLDNNTSCAVPSNSAWHYLVATQTGTAAHMYIDGVQCTSATESGPIGNAVDPVDIGRFNSAYYFNGSIDDVRIWNRVLSAAEVTSLYNEYR